MQLILVKTYDLHYVTKWKCVSIQDLHEHSEITVISVMPDMSFTVTY